jgi:hypothetical protein
VRDIREIIQSALDSAFYGKVDVTPEELISEELPDEYITYVVVSGGYTHYADNRPIRKKEYVDVKWRGLDITIKSNRMEEIETAMRKVGFLPQDLPSDLYRDETAQYFGATQEFALSREVPYAN